MAIIGESRSEKRNREAQRDDALRDARQMSELTGEPLEYLDEFTYDPRWVRAINILDRLPKCLQKPLKSKEEK